MDGPKLPFLNFTTVCAESGRYVIFYNERLDEVIYPAGYQLQNVYTELCEVTVKGISYNVLIALRILFYMQTDLIGVKNRSAVPML